MKGKQRFKTHKMYRRLCQPQILETALPAPRSVAFELSLSNPSRYRYIVSVDQAAGAHIVGEVRTTRRLARPTLPSRDIISVDTTACVHIAQQHPIGMLTRPVFVPSLSAYFGHRSVSAGSDLFRRRKTAPPVAAFSADWNKPCSL